MNRLRLEDASRASCSTRVPDFNKTGQGKAIKLALNCSVNSIIYFYSGFFFFICFIKYLVNSHAILY